MTTRRPKARPSGLLELLDAHELTQYGARNRRGGHLFHNHPRRPLEVDLSLILGRVSVAVAEELVRHAVVQGSAVRYTSVEKLRKAGFRCLHTPTPGNPLHVSVYYDDNEWTRDVAAELAACFTEAYER